MSCILFADEEETNRKINIDDLYEKKQKKDQKQLSIFNKILNRIHKRITHTAKSKLDEKHIWFVVPEYIFGEPCYSKGDCIGYLVAKLEDNGFHVRYVYPSNLFISWLHWIPSYVRSEVKKTTGIVIDERGNIISKKEDENSIEQTKTGDKTPAKGQKQYTPIDNYKPTGNLIYGKEMFEKLEKKVNMGP
jgi:Family of unknown function (DUF5759)